MLRFLRCLAFLVLGLALTAYAGASITYPQVAVGGGYETVIAITNPTDEIWTGQLSFKSGNESEFPVPLKANGQPIGPVSTWTIQPHGTARFVITGDGEAASGYLEVSTQSGPSEDKLAAAVFFRLRDPMGTPVDLVGTHSAKPVRKAVFPIDRSPAVDTGIAILIPEQSADPVVLTLKDVSGFKVQEVKLARKGHVAMMASDLFDQLPGEFLGSVTVESPQPVRLLVLRLEISQGMVQLSGTAPLSLAGAANDVDTLTFEPIEAEYSSSLDRIVAIAANPNRLYLYDPVTKTTDQINLDAAPVGLSVGPDGHFAVVRYANASASYVDLVGRKIEKAITLPNGVTEAVLAGNGYIYLTTFIQEPTSVDYQVVSMRISDGQLTRSPLPSRPDQPFARVHPDGNSFYMVDLVYPSRMFKFDIRDGAAVYAYESSSSDHYQTWFGPFEFSEDGKRIIATGGPVIRSSNVRSQDMQANGTLKWNLTHVAHSEEAGRIAVITRTESLYPEMLGTELWTYDWETLEKRATVSLPSFAPESAVQSFGKYLFYNSGGTKLFVVVRADPGAQVTGGSHGVVVYDVPELEGNR